MSPSITGEEKELRSVSSRYRSAEFYCRRQLYSRLTALNVIVFGVGFCEANGNLRSGSESQIIGVDLLLVSRGLHTCYREDKGTCYREDFLVKK